MIWGVTGVGFIRRKSDSSITARIICLPEKKSSKNNNILRLWSSKTKQSFEEMRSIDDFPTLLLTNKFLEMQHRNAIFLWFFNNSHAFVVSQIICLSEKCKTRNTYILLYITNLIHTQYSIKCTFCILWHAYQLATSQVRSQLINHKKIATLNLIRILQVYMKRIFPVNLLLLICLLIVIQMCFFNHPHEEISSETF